LLLVFTRGRAFIALPFSFSHAGNGENAGGGFFRKMQKITWRGWYDSCGFLCVRTTGALSNE
jgi:hypothetical protein